MIEEAGIRIEIPEGVFYNPMMRINRDLTEALVLALGVKSYADVMAASGIRGFRIARHNVEVFLNDRSRRAYATILWNAERLGLDVQVSNKDAREFMLEHRVEFLDLDPFGTPMPFLAYAIDSMPRYLGVTATDTANLCGKYKHAARKLYFVSIAKTPFCHEIGLRILLYAIAREAARNDLIIEPILSYSRRHHMRVVVEISRAGSSAVENMLDQIGFFRFDPERYEIEILEGFSEAYGPIWLGDLGNPYILKRLRYEFLSDETRRVLDLLPLDSISPIGYYDLHVLASILKVSPKKRKEVIEMLLERGVYAHETHFSTKAIKTVDGEALKEILKARSHMPR